MAGSVLEQWDINDEGVLQFAIAVAEIHELVTITVTIAKTVLPYYMPEQGVVRSYFGIQNTHHEYNDIFSKVPLNRV